MAQFIILRHGSIITSSNYIVDSVAGFNVFERRILFVVKIK